MMDKASYTILNVSPDFGNTDGLGARVSMMARCGNHFGLQVGAGGCNGTAYYATISQTGDGQMTKEYKHPSAIFTVDDFNDPIYKQTSDIFYQRVRAVDGVSYYYYYL
jgi:hypothetical protein